MFRDDSIWIDPADDPLGAHLAQLPLFARTRWHDLAERAGRRALAILRGRPRRPSLRTPW